MSELENLLLAIQEDDEDRAIELAKRSRMWIELHDEPMFRGPPHWGDPSIRK